MNYLQNIGTYFLMIAEMFRKPETIGDDEVNFKKIEDLVIDSLGIVAFVSFCWGCNYHSNCIKYY